MQGRVIKFNLVGAICIFILIIAIIVGLIVYVPKITSSKEEKKDSGVNKEKSEMVNKIDEDKEYIDIVIINNEEKEIITKKCVGTFGYVMNYDVNSFYIEKNKDNVDYYNSLYSDTISIQISEENIKFDNIIQSLNNENDDTLNENEIIEYQIINGYINDVQYICEIKKTHNYVFNKYYMKKDDQSCIIIDAKYGSYLEDLIAPIIDKMIKTFELI